MARILVRIVLGIALLMLLLVVGVVALGRFDARFRVGDWGMVFNAVTGLGGTQATAGTVQQGFVLPADLSISLYSGQVPKARMLRPTRAGDLLVSQPRLGQITLLGRDADDDGRPDRQAVLLSGLDRPHGMDIHDGWLYVAEAGAIGRVRFDAEAGAVSGKYEHVFKDLPEGGNHWTRTLRVGPDGWLYVTVGSSCNVCREDNPWRATMLRLRPDGSRVEVYASGLRNSVGFDWAPWSGELFATDNGRDLLGDDFPPCELNRVEQGGFYGWPHINGFGVPDPDFGDGEATLLKRAIAPVHGFRAHNAPLGMSFLRSTTFTERFGHAAIAALHGSWNRSTPDGYRVVLLQWSADGKIRESDFLTGFQRAGEIIGRPVDVAESPDGVVFVSDDYAGAVYRVAAGKPGAKTVPLLKASGKNPARALEGISGAERKSAQAGAAALMDKYACVGCHVPGSPLAAKWTELGERYTVADLTAFFLAPTPPMPVFPLTEAERRQLAIHLLDPG